MEINSSVIRLFLLIMLMALSVLGCQITPTSKPDKSEAHLDAHKLTDKLFVSLETRKIKYTPRDYLNIRFVLRNNTNRSITILKWNTPLEGFKSDFLYVSDNGKRVPYTGKLVDRAPISKNDFITIPAGKSKTVVLNLEKGYAIRQPGHYSIHYSPQKVRVSERVLKKHGQAVYLAQKIGRLNATEIYVKEPLDPCGPVTDRKKRIPPDWEDSFPDEGDACDARPPPSSTVPEFYNCTSNEETIIYTALNGSRLLVTESHNAMVNGPNHPMRPLSPRYTNWFGHYNLPNWNAVTSSFSKMENVLKNYGTSFDCGCDDADLNAYTYSHRPTNIWICTNFWNMPTSGSQTQASVILHESSHWEMTANTGDYAYGETETEQLADDDPAKAINNADSYEHFSTNQPPLSMFYQETRPACSSSEDCPAGDVCRNGICVRSSFCRDSSWCSDSQVCYMNRCLMRGNDCERIVNCPIGASCIDGSCVSPPTECESDDQCGDNAVCRNDLCIDL